MQPYYGFGISLSLTLSYLTMDTLAIFCFYEERTAIQNQTIIHHFLSITGFLGTIFGGYGLPGISNAALLCEFSSLFLNYRHYFNNQNNGGGISGLLNQVLFFIFFVLTRMFLGPYLIWLIYMDMFAMWQFRTSL